MCQLQYLIARYRNDWAELELTCRYQADSSNSPLEEPEATLSLYETAIQVSHRVPSQARPANKLCYSPDMQGVSNGRADNLAIGSETDAPTLGELGEFQPADEDRRYVNQLLTESNTPRRTTDPGAPIEPLQTPKGIQSVTPRGAPTPRNTKLSTMTRLVCDISKLLRIQKSIIVVTKGQETDWITVGSSGEAEDLAE